MRNGTIMTCLKSKDRLDGREAEVIAVYDGMVLYHMHLPEPQEPIKNLYRPVSWFEDHYA